LQIAIAGWQAARSSVQMLSVQRSTRMAIAEQAVAPAKTQSPGDAWFVVVTRAWYDLHVIGRRCGVV
jgi:hypothetical protein